MDEDDSQRLVEVLERFSSRPIPAQAQPMQLGQKKRLSSGATVTLTRVHHKHTVDGDAHGVWLFDVTRGGATEEIVRVGKTLNDTIAVDGVMLDVWSSPTRENPDYVVALER